MTDEMRRPPAVTVACLGAAFIAVVLTINSTSALSSWGSLEMQEIVGSALESAGLDSRGVTVGTALSVLRVSLYVVTVLSIATGVFALYAMRGHRQSRLMLTILSVFGGLLLTMGGGLALLLPAVILVAVAFVLWTPEARVWFDVTNDRTPRPELVARAKARMAPRDSTPPDSTPRDSTPRAAADVDAVEGRAPAAPPPPGQSAPPHISGVTPPPPPGAPQPHLPYGRRSRLPGTVVAAAITMIAGSFVTAFYTAGVAFLYVMRAVAPEMYEQAAGDEPLLPELMYGLSRDDDTVTLTVLVLSVLALVAVLAMAAGIALLVGRRRMVAAASALAALGAVVSVVVAPALPATLLITAASVATYVLLRHRVSRAWAAQ